MFRKIRSNPVPNLYLELRKEFGSYLDRLASLLNSVCSRYPRQFFAMMVLSILISGILAFTVLRVAKTPALPTLDGGSSQTVTDGLGNIIQSGQALKEVLELQDQINTVLHKDSLEARDSLVLRNAIYRLETINHNLNPKPQ
ncbi:MAG: hypothetical protein EOO20_00405 [Chryseobacterium sp.]|nr:MAG: hypothetical protein EOO20_00405 [Chryseobacterium sp.]